MGAVNCCNVGAGHLATFYESPFACEKQCRVTDLLSENTWLSNLHMAVHTTHRDLEKQLLRPFIPLIEPFTVFRSIVFAMRGGEKEGDAGFSVEKAEQEQTKSWAGKTEYVKGAQKTARLSVPDQ